MAKIEWDKTGERKYQLGVSNVALYKQDKGAYPKGVAWNGITAIKESPEALMLPTCGPITSSTAASVQARSITSPRRPTSIRLSSASATAARRWLLA